MKPRKPKPKTQLKRERKVDRVFRLFEGKGLVGTKKWDLTPRQMEKELTRAGYALEHQGKIRLSNQSRIDWLASHGSTKPWEKMSPAQQQRLVQRFKQNFAMHGTKMMEATRSSRVRSDITFLRFLAAKSLSRLRKIENMLDYPHISEELIETLGNEAVRKQNAVSVIKGIADALSPPHRRKKQS